MKDLPDILAEILAHKRAELQRAVAEVPLETLRRRAAEAPAPRDMVGALRRSEGGPVRLIAEVKRRSPSAGLIRTDFDAARLARRLEQGGADAVSVLTDEKYFGGSLDFLGDVRDAVAVPILRKDFLVDAYQVWQSRAAGADAFLLIADALEGDVLGELLALGRRLGMEALVESHDPAALDRAVASGATLLGINNRNLRSFTVDLDTTVRLADRVPPGRILVAESGVRTAADVSRLLAAGAQAVLVGEALMRSDNPGEVIREFRAAR